MATNRAAKMLAESASSGPQIHRQIMSDRSVMANAASEIGKLGLGLDTNAANWGDDRSSLLNKRTELRRASTQLNASIQKLVTDNPAAKWNSEHQATYEARLDAIGWINSAIHLIETSLDDSFEQASSGGGTAAQALKDSDGRRVGIVLSNDALRDRNRLANALGTGWNQDGMDLASFVRGVANMRTTESVRNALSEGTNTAGGYTVPTILLPGVLNALAPASSLLNAGASIALLQDGAKSFNIAGVDSLPTAAWRSEAGNVAESDPAFRSITITPQSLAFRFKVSRELLADSQNLEDTLRRVIAVAFAKEIDRAGLRGSGTTPEIRGLLNTTGIATVNNGTNGASLTNFRSLIDAWKAIVTVNAPAPTAAIMHPRDMASFANVVDSTGQPLQRPELLNGLAFHQTSQIPTNLTVGTSTDCSEIYVGDFANFVIFMREGVSIQLATELHAATGEVGFICHTRVDVAALYPQAFAVIKGIRA